MKIFSESRFFTPIFQRRFYRYFILAFLLDLMLAPVVQATTNVVDSQGQSLALGLLIAGTIAISIYLFAVIFQPEKF